MVSKESILNRITSNWRGGLIGIVVFLLLWGMFFFIAFMTAFGNDTPASRAILHGAGAFFVVANPLWGIPLAYCAGTIFVRKDAEAGDGD